MRTAAAGSHVTRVKKGLAWGMAMRDLVAADCGGPNALTKLTRHFAKDENRRLIDQGASRGKLQNGMTLVSLNVLTKG